MVFSSLIFLYGFFSLSLLAYSLCRSRKAQNWVLLIFSLIFYAWGEPKYVLLLMFMAFASWACALGVDRASSRRDQRGWVMLAAVIDIGLIGYFKYAGLICGIFGTVPDYVRSIALPIGISFYTFQLLTYVVDVYRGDARAQRSYWNVLLYAALFHQCIAGPIVRYKTIDRELFGAEPRKPELAQGVSRFCAGLAKKVLLANPCGALADTLILADSVASDPGMLAANLTRLGSMSVLGAWVGILAYALHIYLDFSAYSDMAIGMGRMLGLHYPENFNYPYISRTVTEFWRRWHISLGTFFRDYVYIPLGGNRGTRLRVVFNTLVVWLLTGLWHGASWNFVLWGLFFLVFLILEKTFLLPYLNKSKVLSHVYVLFFLMISWAIFAVTDFSQLGILLQRMFGFGVTAASAGDWLYYLRNYAVTFLVGILFSTPLPWKCYCKVRNNRAVNLLILGGILVISVAYLVDATYNPFLYFRF